MAVLLDAFVKFHHHLSHTCLIRGPGTPRGGWYCLFVNLYPVWPRQFRLSLSKQNNAALHLLSNLFRRQISSADKKKKSFLIMQIHLGGVSVDSSCDFHFALWCRCGNDHLHMPIFRLAWRGLGVGAGVSCRALVFRLHCALGFGGTQP